MSWQYNPSTQQTEPRPNGIIAREVLEEAAEQMFDAGIANRNEIVDCLAALSRLSRAEVAFTVSLVANDPCRARTHSVVE